MRTHVSTKVRDTYSYYGIKYIMLGHLTKKFDVYNFRVVLHGLILSKVLGFSPCKTWLSWQGLMSQQGDQHIWLLRSYVCYAWASYSEI